MFGETNVDKLIQGAKEQLAEYFKSLPKSGGMTMDCLVLVTDSFVGNLPKIFDS